MRGIENYAITRLAHPIERAHIGDEIVVTEGRAALRETEFFVAECDELFRNVLHIPRREELTFLYVDRATRFGGGAEQIRLPAEKCGNLQQVDLFPGNCRFRRRMHVGCDWNFQVAADGRQNLAAFAHTDSAKRTH